MRGDASFTHERISSARERKVVGCFGEAGSFLPRRDEAAWQASVTRSNAARGIMIREMDDELALSCTSSVTNDLKIRLCKYNSEC